MTKCAASYLDIEGVLAHCRRTYTIRSKVMSTNKDQVRGRVKEAKGKLKQVVGKLVGDRTLEAKGKVQKKLGAAQAKYGDVKQDVRNAKKSA
jgi:uncharacterized protein YjbJ (UPF0337 family)